MAIQLHSHGTCQAADIVKGEIHKGHAAKHHRADIFSKEEDPMHLFAFHIHDLGEVKGQEKPRASLLNRIKEKIGLYAVGQAKLNGENHHIAFNISSIAKRYGLTKQEVKTHIKNGSLSNKLQESTKQKINDQKKLKKELQKIRSSIEKSNFSDIKEKISNDKAKSPFSEPALKNNYNKLLRELNDSINKSIPGPAKQAQLNQICDKFSKQNIWFNPAKQREPREELTKKTIQDTKKTMDRQFETELEKIALGESDKNEFAKNLDKIISTLDIFKTKEEELLREISDIKKEFMIKKNSVVRDLNKNVSPQDAALNAADQFDLTVDFKTIKGRTQFEEEAKKLKKSLEDLVVKTTKKQPLFKKDFTKPIREFQKKLEEYHTDPFYAQSYDPKNQDAKDIIAAVNIIDANKKMKSKELAKEIAKKLNIDLEIKEKKSKKRKT